MAGAAQPVGKAGRQAICKDAAIQTGLTMDDFRDGAATGLRGLMRLLRRVGPGHARACHAGPLPKGACGEHPALGGAPGLRRLWIDMAGIKAKDGVRRNTRPSGGLVSRRTRKQGECQNGAATVTGRDIGDAPGVSGLLGRISPGRLIASAPRRGPATGAGITRPWPAAGRGCAAASPVSCSRAAYPAKL